MADAPRRVSEIASYHAHIYFDSAGARAKAEQLRNAIAERFSVRLGRWHEVPVGPHTVAMYQVAFDTGAFASFVPFLMLNHAGLSILIHPNTSDQQRDHLSDALWIGPKLGVRADMLPREGPPNEAGEPNTSPSITA